MSHHEEKTMNLTLYVWRQTGPNAPGKLEQYDAKNVSPDQSFLEMLDEVNEQLIKSGKDPISFDHDCREGICGMCSQVINGVPHGGQERTTVCQLHMRTFKNGDSIYIEPWRARGLPPHQGPDRGPLGTGADHPGRRLHLLPHRRCRGRQCPAGSQAGCRLCHGRRRVHRLRRLHGGLPQRLRHALYLRQGGAAGGASARQGRGCRARLRHDRSAAEGTVSATAATTTNARPPVRKGSA